MAKKRRAAEALLAWRAPPDCESFLLSPGPGPLPKRPRSDPDGGKDYRGRKRKRAPGAAEEDAQQQQPLQDEEGEMKGKRRAKPKGSGPQKESAALLLEENPPRRRQQPQLREGGMDEESAEGDAKSSQVLRPPESEEDVWRYNSFQYWRSPLPPIDLTDILDLGKDDSVEMRNVGSIGFSEMET